MNPPRHGEGDRSAKRNRGGGSPSLRKPTVYTARKLRKTITLAREGAHGVLLALVSFSGACQFVPGTEAKAVADAKEQISQELIDPSSAQFRRVVYAMDDPLTICGEINGKNKLGAYTGFKRFIVAPTVNMHQISLDHKPQSGQTDDDEAALTENQYWFEHAWKNGCEAAFTAG